MTGHVRLLETEQSQSSRLAISNRAPLVDPLNILQANILVKHARTGALLHARTHLQANILVKHARARARASLGVLRDDMLVKNAHARAP